MYWTNNPVPEYHPAQVMWLDYLIGLNLKKKKNNSNSVEKTGKKKKRNLVKMEDLILSI